MANVVLPPPENMLGIGVCPHCGTKITVKIDGTWFRFLKQMQQLINQQLI